MWGVCHPDVRALVHAPVNQTKPKPLLFKHASNSSTSLPQVLPVAVVAGPITAGATSAFINASASICSTGKCKYFYEVDCGRGVGLTWRKTLLGVAFATLDIKLNAGANGISTLGQTSDLTCDVTVSVTDNGLRPPATSDDATTTLTVSPRAPKLLNTTLFPTQMCPAWDWFCAGPTAAATRTIAHQSAGNLTVTTLNLCASADPVGGTGLRCAAARQPGLSHSDRCCDV